MRLRAIWTAAMFAVAAAGSSAPAQAEDGKARLDAIFTEKLAAYPGIEVLPAADRARGLGCVVDAFLADIPEKEAGRLADMFEKKIPAEKALLVRWLITEKGDNPARHQQVKTRIEENCPDLAERLNKPWG